jgi:Protein of unknown function (DUF2778)
MTWIYVQKTGQLLDDEGKEVAVGYAGHGEGKNNPAMEGVHNTGPLPCGLYIMEDPRDRPHCGRFAISLRPHLDNRMFGRNDFYVHGEKLPPAKPGEASNGCPIIDFTTRKRMWESGDHYFSVVSELPEVKG